jgi:hypothetical protein
MELLLKATDTDFTVEHLMQAVSVSADVCTLMPGKMSSAWYGSTLAHPAIIRACLRPLKAPKEQNARGVAANHDSQMVNRVRNQKWRTGIYGLRQASGALCIIPDAIPEIIVKAAELILTSNPGIKIDELSSRA